MPDRCSTDLAELYDAIMARTKGRQVQTAGAKARQVGYQAVPLEEMIRMYRQLYKQCGAASGLPELDELAASTAPRGVIRLRQVLR